MHLRNAVPYQAALISPTPETFLNSLMVAGFFFAMSASVALENTTNAGISAFFASSSRSSFSASNSWASSAVSFAVSVTGVSGSGKSTIIQSLLNRDLNLSFSISATSRAPRGTEKNGIEYYFITPDEFRERIANDEFLEYEEVYAGKFYGTLKSEVERILDSGKNVIFDVDVVGGLNIKKYYGNQALALFIQPPSIQALEQRLKNRATDTPEVIAHRIAKAEYELSFAPKFDRIIVNDILEKAQEEAYRSIRQFLDK